MGLTEKLSNSAGNITKFKEQLTLLSTESGLTSRMGLAWQL